MSGGTGEKVSAAFLAMKHLGISKKEVWPVLKNLLQDNEYNWELIEDANYHLLADQIFEAQEAGNSSPVRSRSQKKPLVDEPSSSLNQVKKRKLDEREEGMVLRRTSKKAAVANLAMREMGIHRDEIKPVLKRLLKGTENNWELIEDANYHLLADQIFEAQEKEIEDKKKIYRGCRIIEGVMHPFCPGSLKKPEAHESSWYLNPRKKPKLNKRAEGMGSTSMREKAIAAIRAMKELGIAAHEAAQELKRLLKDSENH